MADTYRQIKVKVKDAVGKLAEVTDALRDGGLNILAVCAWSQGDEGHLLALTDDNETACAVVHPVVDQCEFQEALCVKVPNKPGELNKIAHTLADAEIAIHLVYSTPADAENATVVLATSDNAKAAELL